MSYQSTHRTFAYLFACAARHLDIARYTEIQGERSQGTPMSLPQANDVIAVGVDALTGGSFYDSMSCITFCALSVEAGVNHIGAELYDHWPIGAEGVGSLGQKPALGPFYRGRKGCIAGICAEIGRRSEIAMIELSQNEEAL